MSDAAGFAVSEGRSTLAAAWNHVETVTVFKRDLYVVDQICLLLTLRGESPPLEITEGDEGYEAFLVHMEGHLPGIVPYVEWFLAVVFPAFVPNARCIFRRGGAPDPPPAPPEEPIVEPKRGLRRWIEIVTGF